MIGKYCLAYDAIDSKQWNGDELKDKIIAFLDKNGAINF